jgi:hypothetical protein
MSQRALELCPDGDPARRLPILVVDAADEEFVRPLLALARGRVQLIVANPPEGGAYVCDGQPGTTPRLSEHAWNEVAGWRLRLGPADALSSSVVEVPGWHSPRLTIETVTDPAALDTEPCERQQHPGFTLPTVDGAEVTIGRGTESDIVLRDPTVSRTHLRILCREGAHVASDARSERGDPRRPPCMLDGAALPLDGSGVALNDGAVIQLGCTRVTYHAGQKPVRRERHENAGSFMSEETPKDTIEAGAASTREALPERCPDLVWRRDRTIVVASAIGLAVLLAAIAWIFVSTP